MDAQAPTFPSLSVTPSLWQWGYGASTLIGRYWIVSGDVGGFSTFPQAVSGCSGGCQGLLPLAQCLLVVLGAFNCGLPRKEPPQPVDPALLQWSRPLL